MLTPVLLQIRQDKLVERVAAGVNSRGLASALSVCNYNIPTIFIGELLEHFFDDFLPLYRSLLDELLRRAELDIDNLVGSLLPW